jgi:hypothetical protein
VVVEGLEIIIAQVLQVALVVVTVQTRLLLLLVLLVKVTMVDLAQILGLGLQQMEAVGAVLVPLVEMEFQV